jgi:SAM-dependent methyltransferase
MSACGQPTDWLRPTAVVRRLLEDVVMPGDLAVDATAGNGHDTEFLAARVGDGGRVLAFDIQAAAIAAARARVAAAGWGSRVDFFQECHTRIATRAVPGSVAAVMFNLGYLPGHGHELTTTAETTLQALAAATSVLRPGGALAAVCYPGHPEGGREAAAVAEWFAGLTDSAWQVVRYTALGTRRPAPFLLFGVAPDKGSDKGSRSN